MVPIYHDVLWDYECVVELFRANESNTVLVLYTNIDHKLTNK